MGSIVQDLSPPTGATTICNDATTLSKTSRREEKLAFHSTDRLDLLWRDFFRDPSQWRDNRSTKTNPRSPDFKHKASEQSLWIFSWFNPCWVQEELRRRGLKATGISTTVEDVAFCIEEKKPVSDTTTHDDEFCLEKTKLTASTMLQIDQKEDSQQEHEELSLERTQPTERFMSQINLITQTGLQRHHEELMVVKDNICQKSEEDMHVSINFVRLLKACADEKDILRGSSIHSDIVRLGLLKSNLIIGSTVVNLYAKCGALAKAQEVLNELPVRNVVAWNALIAGYAQQERGQEALNCFERMQSEGIFPDVVTIVCILNACGSVGAIDKGQEIHAHIIKEGLLDVNVVVANALVDMYASCRVLSKARDVFYELPIWDVVSWTTLITGFVRHGHGKEALDCFEMMQLHGFVPNMATRLCILKACGIEGAVHKGQEVQAALIKDGSLGNNMMAGTALVDMYAKCGLLAEAQKLFEELPMQDVVSWGALLEGYAQHTDGEEALYCFERMQDRGIVPDAVTFICILKASGSVGSAYKGQEIHAYIAREGLLEKDSVSANSLVDMYAKCGMLAEAQDVFDELLVRNVVSWNALIAGYGQLGEEELVSSLYNRMIREGTEPDFVTFTIVLNACCHRGLLSKGQMYFESMSRVYGIAPTLEHLTCMVDLFGRTGHIDKAVALIKAMPVRADSSAWHAVLSACQSLGNIKLGTWAFKHALLLDRKHSAAYVCISNTYAAFGKQRDVEEIKALSGHQQPLKDCHWIDVAGFVHSFCIGDNRKHVQIELIYAKLEYIARRQLLEGYCSDLHPGLHNLKGVKPDVLCGHGEKLAIACALINTPDEARVIIFKNMCVCYTCHSDIALISKIEKRKIFVRDVNRFHSFQDGKCDCEEFGCLDLA